MSDRYDGSQNWEGRVAARERGEGTYSTSVTEDDLDSDSPQCART